MRTLESILFFAVLVCAVAFSTNAGSASENRFEVKKPKIEKTLSPTLGVPVIVRAGETFKLHISETYAGAILSAEIIPSAVTSEQGMPARELSMNESGIFSVPENQATGLYDLAVKFSDGTSETQYHSVKVIGEYKKDFNFAVIADIHFGDTRGDYFAPGKDFDTLRKNTIIAAGGAGVEFVLLAGDVTSMPNDYTRDYEKAWTYFRDYCAAPVFLVPGNHDGYGIKKGNDYFLDGRVFWEQIFGQPHFYFDYGEMRVVGIDNFDWPAKFRSSSNLALLSETEALNHGNMGPAQFAWLEETLSGAGDKNIIAFTHIQLDWMLGGTTSKGGVKIPGVPKEEIIKLLADNKVSHVFIGHMHRNETKDISGIQQVMTNTSGSVLYNESQRWGFSIVHVKDWKVDSVEFVETDFD